MIVPEVQTIFRPEEEQVPRTDVPMNIQNALRDLTRRFESGTDIARREYVRKVLRNHELFRGNAWRWFDYQTGSWRAYNTTTGGMTNVTGGPEAQSLYSVNIFQGYALSFIALLSSNKLTVKWWPQNARSPEDIEAAKKCDAVMRWFKNQEKAHSKLVKKLYYLWCDGTFGSYVRSVADGDRYGWIEEPVVEMVERQVGEPQYQCELCGTVNVHGIGCGSCGTPLPEEPNVPAPVIREEVPVGVKRIPKSRTKEDVVGGLELKLPPVADSIEQFEYLIRQREVLKATVRATWPDLANEISGGQVGSPRFDGATSTIEKRARLQVAYGTTADNRPVPVQTADYVTLTEIWFSKKAFYELDNPQERAQLLEMFPNGAYVAFADDTFLEARPENMLDHWRICHALPGDGQIREPIGGSLVQIQEMANDLANIIRDVIEYTLPITFVDSQVLDIRKWARSNVLAGAAYPARALPGQPLGAGFHQTEPGRLPEYAVGFFNDLRNSIAQFASGVFPAAYGGSDPGNEAIDVDEVIPTPKGFVRNGDLVAGDEIFGDDGKVYKVLAAHPEMENESFLVSFDDGTSVVADAKHRWRTFTVKERDAILNRGEGRREYVRAWRRKNDGQDVNAPRGKTGPKPMPPPSGTIRTTQEILDTLIDKRGRVNHAVKVVSGPVDLPDAVLPIDPYVLGVWLGDGCATNGTIACSPEDGPGMAERFAAAGIELYQRNGENQKYVWQAVGLNKAVSNSGLDLKNNKHVPDIYLWASAKQRLALLQGLMDTDGWVSTEGKIYFSNTNKRLIDGVYHLAASIGCKPRVSESVTNDCVDRKTGKLYQGGKPIWTVRWSSPLPVFRMQRKLSRVRSDMKANKRAFRYITNVEPVGKRRVRCITVSNPTELYLFGRNFNCTANTAQGREISRNSALGRVSVFLRAINEHESGVAELVVKDFKRNASEAITVVSTDQFGDFRTDVLEPSDMEVGEAHTYPELDEDYPTTWPQRQALLMQMMANPLFQGVLTMLANADNIRRTLGHDLQLPGESQYRRAFKVIKDLLTQQPMPGPPVPVMDPMTGMPVVDPMTGQPAMQPGPMMPSIPPDLLDDATVNLTAAIDYAFSDDGDRAKATNPNGWQNFMLWVQANHDKMASGQPNALTPPPPPMPQQGAPQGPPMQ